MQEWISIKQAQKIANWSTRTFTRLIDNNTIIGTKLGVKGSKRLINTKSLRDYLETISQPMGL